MIEAGLVTREMRVELLDGVITEKMGTGSIHDFIVRRFAALLLRRLTGTNEVGVQSPVLVPPESRPEPDLWVSRQPEGSHRDLTVEVVDLLLVIEVADSSLTKDRTVKLPIYARAGLPELWIVNVAGEEIERHRLPRPDGTYGSKEVYGRADVLASELAGEIEVAGVLG